jgi:hypothetical protein
MNVLIARVREKCLVRIVLVQEKSESWTLPQVNILTNLAKNAVAQGLPNVIFVQARALAIVNLAKEQGMLPVKNVMEKKN